MDKAVTYAMNRRDTAETYLEDGRCSFTNNLSENAIRPFAVGRKNWLFSDSVNGANASAVVYTMVEMARAHDLNIYGYLKYLLEQRPSEEMTDEQLSELAPGVKTPIYQRSQVTCSKLLQRSKGWSDFIPDRRIIWRLRRCGPSGGWRLYSGGRTCAGKCQP